MQICKRLGQMLIIPHQATKLRRSAKIAFDDPPLGQQDAAFFRFGQLDHFQAHVMGLGRLGSVVPYIPLAHKHGCDCVAGDRLHCVGQRTDLAPILHVRGGDVERQQIAQSIHRHMDFGAMTAPNAVIPHSGAAFGCRWEGAAIEDRRREFRLVPLCEPQYHAQVMDDCCKHAGLQPALAWLVHRIPRRQVMRHQAPCSARPYDPAQPIEHLAQAVRTLRGICWHAGHLGGHKSPLIITDITGVCFAFHATSLASSERKCITPSRGY